MFCSEMELAGQFCECLGTAVDRFSRRPGHDHEDYIRLENASAGDGLFQIPRQRREPCEDLTKPFHVDELAARIHAIVRRSRGYTDSIMITYDYWRSEH